LDKILIYSKYTLFNVTIVSMPFMLIIIHEYTFINPNTPNYIPWNSQNTPLYTHKVIIKLATFVTNVT
jgi:hypothetical protein